MKPFLKRIDLMRWVNRQFTLSEQFLMVSFAILVTGMIVIGSWVANRVERAVIDQTASVTALYMESFVSPLLQPLTTHDKLDTEQHRALQRLVVNTPLGSNIVSVKIWSPDGVVLFSLNSSLIGTRFSVDDDLRTALSGHMISGIASMNKDEQTLEREFNIALIETYIPVRANGTDRVIAVAEFYLTAESLMAQIRGAQQQSWLVVAIATMTMYSLLNGLFARGSRTIARQQGQLQLSVDNLSALLAENQALQHQLQEAAARASEINEQLLHRIGRDLHDGPAQDLALALLRLDEICQTQPEKGETIRTALQSALKEIRTLAAGLQLPELEPLQSAEVARRAVREFQRKTGGVVETRIDEPLFALSLPQKIALYRVIIEALNNALHHAAGKDMYVYVAVNENDLLLEVRDGGPGFDPSKIDQTGNRLGIAGLQQRVRLLGGKFDIESAPETGTCVRVNLPLKGHSNV